MDSGYDKEQEKLENYEEIEFDHVQAQNVIEFEGKKLKVYNRGINIQNLPEWRAVTFFVDVCNDDGSLLLPGVQVYSNSEPLVKQLEQIKDNPQLINKPSKVKVVLHKEKSGSGWEFLTFSGWS